MNEMQEIPQMSEQDFNELVNRQRTTRQQEGAELTPEKQKQLIHAYEQKNGNVIDGDIYTGNEQVQEQPVTKDKNRIKLEVYGDVPTLAHMYNAAGTKEETQWKKNAVDWTTKYNSGKLAKQKEADTNVKEMLKVWQGLGQHVFATELKQAGISEEDLLKIGTTIYAAETGFGTAKSCKSGQCISTSGALGHMQIKPDTFKSLTTIYLGDKFKQATGIDPQSLGKKGIRKLLLGTHPDSQGNTANYLVSLAKVIEQTLHAQNQQTGGK
jgi:hypothetical protein